jgi:alkylresorcinol/alkylpyrone synthase
MFVSGLGTATPATRYTQAQCWEALVSSNHLDTLSTRSQAILQKVLRGNSGICSRFLAIDDLSEAFDLDPDALDARFAKHGPTVAAIAAERALMDAGVTTRDIDAVTISTCTGYLCPGLSSYVSELLGLRNDILALDLVGQGCGAALPNMRAAEALIASGRAGRVLSVCVEICSAAMYLDDDPGVLISACLFGDGAGAAVLTADAIPGRRRIRWRSTGTLLNAADRDELRFERRRGMLRNILTPAVPALAAKYVEAVLNECLEHEGLTRDDISGWILHAGGREILAAIHQRLDLTDEDTRWSAAILRDYGNVSSACVYFVLQAALNGHAPGGHWWMSSFGAGFSCHGALLDVSEITSP